MSMLYIMLKEELEFIKTRIKRYYDKYIIIIISYTDMPIGALVLLPTKYKRNCTI